MNDHQQEKTDTKLVRVYELLDPALLVRNEEFIEQIFGKILGIDIKAKEHVFYISPGSGWLYYANTKKQWDGNMKPGLPPTIEHAKKYAGAFLTEVATAFRDVKKYPFLQEFEGCDFIPPLAKVFDCNYVSNKSGEPDHILVRYQTALYGDDDYTKYPVVGAIIEIRVGEYGKIIGFNSHWSITRQKFIRTPLVAFEKSDDGHSHEGEEQEPVLVYSLGGDHVPQYLLSPYYITKSGHHSVERSACKYSLTAKFGYHHQQDQSLIQAQVHGGSGNYSFQWYYYKLEEVMHKGIINAGDSGPELRIPESCYAWVCCHIVDNETNAYLFHTEQSIGEPIVDEVSNQDYLV